MCSLLYEHRYRVPMILPPIALGAKNNQLPLEGLFSSLGPMDEPKWSTQLTRAGGEARGRRGMAPAAWA
jgi:hypothetical protein